MGNGEWGMVKLVCYLSRGVGCGVWGILQGNAFHNCPVREASPLENLWSSVNEISRVSLPQLPLLPLLPLLKSTGI